MNNVISCVRTKDRKYKAIVRLSNKYETQALPMKFLGVFMNRTMWMNYHTIRIDKSVTDNELEQFDENNIQDYI